MNKRTIQIIGIGLLIVFLGYLMMMVLPSGERKVKNSNSGKTQTSYEPKFKKEGELYLIDANSFDTIKRIDIELAETVEEISYGMMYRKSMDPETGMLFLMGNERPQSFYMKNTYVSLDIIFINDDMEIVSIQKNAEPLNEKSLPSEGPASYVLEVKGGFSDQYGLVKGTRMVYQRTQ
jgi:uncharacterized membrane protein (UPF0127 family)